MRKCKSKILEHHPALAGTPPEEGNIKQELGASAEERHLKQVAGVPLGEGNIKRELGVSAEEEN